MTDTLLPQVLFDKAREVVEANRKAHRRVAVAESCTGGLVSAALTEIPGSSEIFEAGFVTYSNAAKINELKVSQEVVETFGSVSVATAWAMWGPSWAWIVFANVLLGINQGLTWSTTVIMSPDRRYGTRRHACVRLPSSRRQM